MKKKPIQIDTSQVVATGTVWFILAAMLVVIWIYTKQPSHDGVSADTFPTTTQAPATMPDKHTQLSTSNDETPTSPRIAGNDTGGRSSSGGGGASSTASH